MNLTLMERRIRIAAMPNMNFSSKLTRKHLTPTLTDGMAFQNCTNGLLFRRISTSRTNFLVSTSIPTTIITTKTTTGTKTKPITIMTATNINNTNNPSGGGHGKRVQRRPRIRLNTTTTALYNNNSSSSSSSNTVPTNMTLTLSSSTTLKSQKKSLSFRFHRLISREDRRWIHKASSIICVLSTCLLLLSFPLMYFSTSHFLLPPSQYLFPLVSIWSFTTIIQSLSGIFLALKYRRTEPCVRNAFISNSFYALFNVCVVLRTLYHTKNNFLFFCLCFTCFQFTFRAIFDFKLLVMSRQETRQKRTELLTSWDSNFKKDALFYVIPELIWPPFCVYIAYHFFGRHSTQWILLQFQMFPALQTAIVSVNVLASLAISLVSLLVTLRDRKVITKEKERTLVSSCSIGTFAIIALIVHFNIGMSNIFQML